VLNWKTDAVYPRCQSHIGDFATVKVLFKNMISKTKLNRVSCHFEVAGCLKTWICVYCLDIKFPCFI
jgi:hypothetical protein